MVHDYTVDEHKYFYINRPMNSRKQELDSGTDIKVDQEGKFNL